MFLLFNRFVLPPNNKFIFALLYDDNRTVKR